MFEISMTQSFEASHYLEPEDGKGQPHYRRIHGHSFIVTASVASAGTDAREGWVMDLGVLEKALKDALAGLDHTVLNEVPGLGAPTFENILLWIEARMREQGVQPSRLEIERPTMRQKCVYTPGR